jgi:hypothetical protein
MGYSEEVNHREIIFFTHANRQRDFCIRTNSMRAGLVVMVAEMIHRLSLGVFDIHVISFMMLRKPSI